MKTRIEVSIEVEAPTRLLKIADALMLLSTELMLGNEENAILEPDWRPVTFGEERLGSYRVTAIPDEISGRLSIVRRPVAATSRVVVPKLDRTFYRK